MGSCQQGCEPSSNAFSVHCGGYSTCPALGASTHFHVHRCIEKGQWAQDECQLNSWSLNLHQGMHGCFQKDEQIYNEVSMCSRPSTGLIASLDLVNPTLFHSP